MLQPAERYSMMPRANPPAPPKLGLGNNCTGALEGNDGCKLRALSTTRILTFPLSSGTEDSMSISRSIVLSTYSWRLKVVIATPSRTSRSNPSVVLQRPPRTTTPASSALTATYKTSAPHVVISVHSSAVPDVAESITNSP